MKKFWLLILICLVPLCFAACEEKKITLSAPGELAINDGVISFLRVSGAEYYTIYINDFYVNVYDRQSEDGKVVFSAKLDKSYLNYNAKSIFELGGTFNVSVKARAGGVSSELSNAVNYSFTERLSTPTELEIKNGNLVWASCVGADYYLVNLPGVEQAVKVVNNSLDITESLSTAGELKFSVVACSNGELLSSAAAELTYFNKVRLATPIIEGVTSEGENLFLNVKVDNHANSITILANNVLVSKEILSNSNWLTRVGESYKINLNTFFNNAVNFNLAGQFGFSVRADFISNSNPQYLNSNFSLNYVYDNLITLTAPELNLKIVGGQYVLEITKVALNSVGVRLKVQYEGYFVEVELNKTDTEYVLRADFVSVSAVAVGAEYYLSSPASNTINHP